MAGGGPGRGWRTEDAPLAPYQIPATNHDKQGPRRSREHLRSPPPPHPPARHLWRGREPICGALAWPEVGCTLQIQTLCSCQQGSNPGSLYRRRGGRRAQGGGGGLKMRPWHRVDFQLQITISKDPGKAGSENVRHPLPTLQPATYGVGGSRSAAPWLGQK